MASISWSSPTCCPEFSPPTAFHPVPWPVPPQTDAGGYLSPAFTAGFDVATPPWPQDSRSRIAAMPPLPAPPLEGYCRVPDPRSPQRRDSEAYRRAVFLGLITPWSEPAVDGVAVDAAEKRRQADLLNAATMHQDDAVQIHPGSQDYDHSPFSQEFG